MIDVGYDILAISGSHADRYLQLKQQLLTYSSQQRHEEPEEPESYILSVQNGIGVIAVHGILTSDDDYYNKYYGMLAYEEIRRAVAEALESEVSAILFDYDTPGGDAYGLLDVADMVSNIPVPTVSHASGMMASAGYMLGMQSDYVYAAGLSDVGSVGVVVKIYNQVKFLEQMGVKAVRFRSGNLKASGDSAFELTDEERAYIQEKVDYMAGQFFQFVADARGTSIEALKLANITSGRTFVGEQAHRVGLIDGVQSFEASALKVYDLARKYIDKKTKVSLF